MCSVRPLTHRSLDPPIYYIPMATHRRVQSARSAPSHPPPHYYPPVYPSDAPDYDYNPRPLPQPPPPPPRPTPPPSQSYFTPHLPTLAFPEPHLYRSTSVGSAPPPRPTLTVSDYDYDAGDFPSPNYPYGTIEPALDPASFGYDIAFSNSHSGGTLPTPYGNGRQFSESSYSFSGIDAYSFSTSDSPERSPSVTFSHLR